jgi:hypothetical protein
MAWTDAARAAAAAKRAGKGLKKSAAKVGLKTGTKLLLSLSKEHKKLGPSERKNLAETLSISKSIVGSKSMRDHLKKQAAYKTKVKSAAKKMSK